MALRLNIGCGRYRIPDWVNIDESEESLADEFDTVPPLRFSDDSVEEIYAGHFLEHLDKESGEAAAFLQECRRVLVPGGKLGILVPDTHEVVKRYLDPAAMGRVEFPIGVHNDVHDLDTVCRLFLYSTVQDSGHLWSYDRFTLTRLLVGNGFRVVADINRWMDPRVAVGAWYQFGLDAVKV